MTRYFLLAMFVMGCGRLGFDPAAGQAPEVDGGPGTTDDDTGSCPGSLVAICAPMTAAVTLNAPFSTDADSRCDASIADTCTIAGSTIDVVGNVAVSGDRPLVLAASQSITISGTLDVSSTATTRGAGANHTSCALTIGESSTTGAGGGAGGSFGTLGGAGGNGGVQNGFGVGALASAIAHPSVLRGGCIGGVGGSGAAKSGPDGGNGGGAVYLYAGGSIQIRGAVLASGAGATATAPNTDGCGGGGGGSGGMIALEAPTVDVSGSVVANGGGGGEGGGQFNFGIAGGRSTTYNLAATGGGDNASGGNGGRGAALGAPADAGLVGEQSASGGGGGGGGLGVVWVKGQLSGTQISPPPTLQ